MRLFFILFLTILTIYRMDLSRNKKWRHCWLLYFSVLAPLSRVPGTYRCKRSLPVIRIKNSQEDSLHRHFRINNFKLTARCQQESISPAHKWLIMKSDWMIDESSIRTGRPGLFWRLKLTNLYNLFADSSQLSMYHCGSSVRSISASASVSDQQFCWHSPSG